MTAGGPDRRGAASAPSRPALSVLADRLAAALMHHEPGWRLPRFTTLARRYQVSPSEVAAAVEELAARCLVRQLPDGQVYRASPAEYRVPLEGVAGLASYVDPLGCQLACQRWHASRRRPPEGIGRALGLATGEPVLVVRCLWTVDGEPAAVTASYLPGRAVARLADGPARPGPAGNGWPGPAGNGPQLFPRGPLRAELACPQALQLELGPPPPSAARSLRMAPGEPVAIVTVSFGSLPPAPAVALTCAMLRPGWFRIVLAAPAGGACRGPSAPG
jgi:hypothetical protein